MNSLKKQAGAGMGSVIFNLIILVLIGFSVAKIAVFYVDDRTVQKAMVDLEEVPYITKKSEREIDSLFRKNLSFSNISLGSDEIFVEKKSDRVIIDVIYERRTNIFSNVDAVVTFENRHEIVGR